MILLCGFYGLVLLNVYAVLPFSLSALIQPHPHSACNEMALKRFHSSNPELLKVMVMRLWVMSASPPKYPSIINLPPPSLPLHTSHCLINGVKLKLANCPFFLLLLFGDSLYSKSDAVFIEVCAFLRQTDDECKIRRNDYNRI